MGEICESSHGLNMGPSASLNRLSCWPGVIFSWPSACRASERERSLANSQKRLANQMLLDSLRQAPALEIAPPTGRDLRFGAPTRRGPSLSPPDPKPWRRSRLCLGASLADAVAAGARATLDAAHLHGKSIRIKTNLQMRCEKPADRRDLRPATRSGRNLSEQLDP